ncbi:MAG: hypothetical protein ABSF71_08440 [Terriglobia bacterium]|jgi:hypothetical protein
MTKISLALVLIAGVLAWLGPEYVLGAQAQPPTEGPKIILLLPEHFLGWACIDFGVVGSPPLPRQGNALIVRPRQGEVLKTSDKPGDFPYYSETWFELNGQRRPLPDDVYGQREVRVSDSKQPVQRYCAFYGTVDEADAAAEPPGFEPSPHQGQGVSEEERQALVALYRATGGDHWYHHVGWLGPPGTECKWHGIDCWSRYNDPAAVRGLDLSQNNLVGSIPQAVGRLPHLEDLSIFGNHVSGMLPQELIQRYFTGALGISAEASLLTDVTKIEFERDPSALLCGRREITLGSDRRAVLFTDHCRNATPEDRATFCEVKEGRVGAGQFAALAWLLGKNGFYALRPQYSRNVTDAAFERTRVTRAGKRYAVENYADGGPFELWVIQAAIEGVASSIEWEKTTTQPECPKWDEPQVSQPN